MDSDRHDFIVRHSRGLGRMLAAITLLICAAAPGGESDPVDRYTADAQRILNDAGVRGGLVLHLDCGDGRLTAALGAREGYVVQGIDADPDNIQRAREHIQRAASYGRISVDSFDGEHLPYIDNLANLVVADQLRGIPMSEVMRVLAPLGVAVIGGNKTTKPWPDAIDEWPHYLHGPDNNALAEDRLAGPPRHMQWLAGPKWTRHHHADKGTYPTIRAVVSSRGRLFYMIDATRSSNRAVPSQWLLAARDAFSGVLLWTKPLAATDFERRLEEVWRTLIADGERVYAPLGTDLPLAAWDAASGAVVREYAGTEEVQEVIKQGDSLFVVDGENGILALRAETGQRLWQFRPEEDDPLVPLTLAASADRVFFKTDRAVHCLSADAGEIIWRVELPGPQRNVRLKWPRERLLVKDGVVLCSFGGGDPKVLDRDRFQYLGSHPRVHEYGGQLAALSAADGRRLWQTEYLPGLESTPGEIYITNGTVWLGPAFDRPRDLLTGAVKASRPVLDRLWTLGHHYRCYPGKATSRYILTAKRGIELIDLAGEDHSRNNWVRATCRVGVTPCNGLLYAPPHSCGCYMEAKLYGFWALSAQRGEQERAVATQPRLLRGPAYAQPALHAAGNKPPVGWWTYRGDAARSGSTPATVPTDLVSRWQTRIGGHLSPVTIADGRLFAAQVDAHTVHALNADTGEMLWQFTAGGRIDSPPTLFEGHVLFGSSDGCAYCLRVSDGELVWRFRAAPGDRRAVAFEQLESLWPVHGSLLVRDGIVYVAAGRSSYLDGGIVLYGLDPATGEVRCTTRLKSEHAGASQPPPQGQRDRMLATIRQNNTDYKTFLAADRSDAFSMRGALTDVMVADGESIFLRQLCFDAGLVQQERRQPHLFSTSSLLDGSEHNRSYWVLGTGDFSRTPVAYPWIVTKGLRVPFGVLLAFDERTVWGIRRDERKGRPYDYAVFAASRPDPEHHESRLPDFAERSGERNAASLLWADVLALRPRALVRAGDSLFVGGISRAVDPETASTSAATAAAGRRPGALQIHSCLDGSTLGNLALTSVPVWDGMAAANGRIYLSLEDGSVVCLEKRGRSSFPSRDEASHH